MAIEYYISYKVRRTDGKTAHYYSKDFQTEAEARKVYDIKMASPKVVEAWLCKHTETPTGVTRVDILADYCNFKLYR